MLAYKLEFQKHKVAADQALFNKTKGMVHMSKFTNSLSASPLGS